MSVKRYRAEIWNHPARGKDTRMVEDGDGNYVRYGDYEALRASHEDLLKAAQSAAGQVNDLRILLTEAQELGLTLFVCGSTYDHDSVLAALANAQKVRHG